MRPLQSFNLNLSGFEISKKDQLWFKSKLYIILTCKFYSKLSIESHLLLLS